MSIGRGVSSETQSSTSNDTCVIVAALEAFWLEVETRQLAHEIWEATLKTLPGEPVAERIHCRVPCVLPAFVAHAERNCKQLNRRNPCSRHLKCQSMQYVRMNTWRGSPGRRSAGSAFFSSRRSARSLNLRAATLTSRISRRACSAQRIANWTIDAPTLAGRRVRHKPLNPG